LSKEDVMIKQTISFSISIIVIAVLIIAVAQAQDVKWTKQLGYELFFDKRISSDNATSCASCHHPDKGWSDGRRKAIGMINNGMGMEGSFNSPTILNTRFKLPQFWDGRANGLSDQAIQPITNPIEMGNASLNQVTTRLNQIPRYRRLFAAAFGSYGITSTRMAYALASFEGDIVSINAPIDKYLAGDKTALTIKQKRGWQLVNHFGCVKCHLPDNDFRDGIVHNTGITARSADNLLGFRGRRAFSTPTWRELKRTAPYMHNGFFSKIDDVIDHYSNGTRYHDTNGNLTHDPLLDARVFQVFKLSKDDKESIKDFLLNATAGEYPYVRDPFASNRRRSDVPVTDSNIAESN